MKIRAWCLRHDAELIESDGPFKIVDGEFDTSDLSCPIDNDAAKLPDYDVDAEYCSERWAVVLTVD